jgi:acyl-CoA thioesterase FadM
MTAPELSIAEGLTVAYRPRFDECGPDGLVRSSALLRYAQDMAWIHSERAGFDRGWYAARGLGWVVRAAELSFLRGVPLGATLQVTTRVVGVRRVWARRRTEARLPDGSLAVWGHTDWVITDERGQPARIPDAFHGRFVFEVASFEPGRVPLPPTPSDAVVLRSVVRPQDLDPMAHVNNAAYVDYLEEALLSAGDDGEAAVAALPRTVRIEYLAPASPRAIVEGAVWRQALDGRPGWSWRLTDAGGRDLARGRVIAGADPLPEPLSGR